MRALNTFKRIARRAYTKFKLRLLAWTRTRSFIVALESGQKLRLRPEDQLAKEILNGESFEKAIREKIFEHTEAGMVVLDIGGNIGYYTIDLAKLVGLSGKVVSFEPNPPMIEELKRNVELNGLQNVIVQPIALSNQSGEAEFHCPRPGWEGHASLRSNVTFQTFERIRVKTRKLDDVLQDLGINSVDLIKIDVEGAERLIFQGARRLLTSHRKPLIFFECAETTCRAFGHCVLDVLRELADCGYQIEQIDYGMWFARPDNRASAATGFVPG